MQDYTSLQKLHLVTVSSYGLGRIKLFSTRMKETVIIHYNQSDSMWKVQHAIGWLNKQGFTLNGITVDKQGNDILSIAPESDSSFRSIKENTVKGYMNYLNLSLAKQSKVQRVILEKKDYKIGGSSNGVMFIKMHDSKNTTTYRVDGYGICYKLDTHGNAIRPSIFYIPNPLINKVN